LPSFSGTIYWSFLFYNLNRRVCWNS
jgi:hypothetical protein